VFRAGTVIPAHPLALTAERRLDESRQRALTRYYIEAGAGGIAVGVHSTQFAIHDPAHGLLAPVLELAAETAIEYAERQVLLVGGVYGDTAQAVAEAELAAALGFHLALVPPHRGLDDDDLLDRVNRVGEVLPVIGFYLQPAVGGRVLGREFWTRFAASECVVGIKVAPFNRYATLEAMHGVARSGRADQIALYTGNDDHILADLATPYRLTVDGTDVELAFVGGLLGQWAVWTRRAAELHARACVARTGGATELRDLLLLDRQLTDANGAIFDAANDFAGCIPGIHEVLRRQGLLAGRWCLDPAEELSPGQAAEIDRVQAAYPHLADDEFVSANLDRWLS
jgi:dihydrodipicolinate synthase/N-acetylneuraminate lyase